MNVLGEDGFELVAGGDVSARSKHPRRMRADKAWSTRRPDYPKSFRAEDDKLSTAPAVMIFSCSRARCDHCEDDGVRRAALRRSGSQSSPSVKGIDMTPFEALSERN